MFDMLKSTSTIFLSFHHHMKPTSSSQRSTVISLLTEGYSVHQIQSKTSLGRSTIGRIKKEVDLDKENNKGGRPSKLSPCDKQSIIRQITTRKLDNAVQATHFINNILPSPITPQTVRNALKQNDFHSVVKQKHPLLKKAH
jgi:transposase